MTSVSKDIEQFEACLHAIQKDFQQYPFHYGNENPVVPELYRRLLASLSRSTVSIDYRQDHSKMDDWRNREMFDRLEERTQEVRRVRSEVTFYDEGIWRGAKSYFDVAIFPAGQTVVMQGKKEGVGNFIDVATSLSVLCEIKHSMNMNGQFRSGGDTDIQALAAYPGEVGRRYFVFLDWWPRDGYGNRTFEKDVRQLRERLDPLDTRVDVAYLPRTGDLQFVREITST